MPAVSTDAAAAPTPPPPPPPTPDLPPQKFKVTAHGLSATISLDSKWLARPFVQAVVKTVVLKLNKRPNVETVAAEYLERVEIDGDEVALPDASTSAAAVVPSTATTVTLVFGEAPPPQLKFVVHSANIEFTITLDARFMRKNFLDAVVKPFVTMYNRRSNYPVTWEQCVEVHVDGEKRAGSYRTESQKSAFAFLGRYPNHVELFFSYEAVAESAKKRKPHNSLRFKVHVPQTGDLQQKEKELVFDHQELNSAEAEEIARLLEDASPLKVLRRIYLQHNDIRDVGATALARVLTKENAPELKRLHLGHNRIGNAGALALATHLSPSPNLDQLHLDHNWIGEAGALALLGALEAATLVVGELQLQANPGLTPAACARLAAFRDCRVLTDEQDPKLVEQRKELFDQCAPVPINAGFPGK